MIRLIKRTTQNVPVALKLTIVTPNREETGEVRQSSHNSSHETFANKYMFVKSAEVVIDANTGCSKAYELPKKEGKVGTPERLLSSLGLLSYKDIGPLFFWTS
ncbi:hypothetical protein Tco_0339353 [Tanacetum coccineum]